METPLKQYIITLKRRAPATPLPKKRREAIQVVNRAFAEIRDEVFDHLGSLGCCPIQDVTRPTVFKAMGGVQFNCLPAIGVILAVVPENIADFLRKDALVSSLTEDQAVKLHPCDPDEV